MKENITVIVPAAGFGRRLGPGTNKPFFMLLDKPLLIRTLEVFEAIEDISEIIPVIKESDMGMASALLEKYSLSKVKRIAPGGRERQDSVYHGLRLADNADIVLVHDGGRPLVDADIVLNAIGGIKGFDGAVAAVPVKDTIKEAENGIIKGTLSRDSLWAVQTPQVFYYEAIRSAYDKAMEQGFYSTDDSSLVEKAGGRVKIVMGSYSNIKITTPEDILMAENLLKERMKA